MFFIELLNFMVIIIFFVICGRLKLIIENVVYFFFIGLFCV